MTTGVTGIGNLPEPGAPRGNRDRARLFESASAPQHDDVEISNAAREAASVGKVIHEAEEVSEIRQEIIEQAKANIEAGTHRVQDVVEMVAARLVSLI